MMSRFVFVLATFRFVRPHNNNRVCDEAVFNDTKQALLFDFACGGLLRCLQQLYDESPSFAPLQSTQPADSDNRAADVSRGWAPLRAQAETAARLPTAVHAVDVGSARPLRIPYEMSLDFGLIGGQALSLRAGWQSWNIASARMLVNLQVAMEFYCGRTSRP